MDEHPLHIVIVEDDEVDRIALKRFFKDKKDAFQLTFFNSIEKGRKGIPGTRFDVILLDYRLRDGECFDLFDVIPVEKPIIIFTGLGNEKIAVQAMKEGAEDYIIKDQENDYLKNIPITIKKALTQKQLKNTIRQFEFIFSSSQDFVFLVDKDYHYVIANDASLFAHRIKRENIIGAHLSMIYDERMYAEKIKPKFEEALSGKAVHFQEMFDFSTRKQRFMDVAFYPYHEKDQRISGVIINMRDITTVKRLQDELQTVKQMQAIGDLSAGIAHQFNNALSSVLGNLDLILLDHPQVLESDHLVQPMFKAIDHMTDLTKKLLAYARGGKYQEGPFRVSTMIHERMPQLKRLAGYHITINTLFEDENARIMADETQMAFVLKAIVQNAVESMERGGIIQIQVRKEQKALSEKKEDEKEFLTIRIEDNGKGMSGETLQRVFEPFYTTHFLGRGLGMAAVYGIIKNHNGKIRVDSMEGKGTVVTISLPVISSD